MRRSRNRPGEPFVACILLPFFWLPRFSSSVTFLASAVFPSCLCFLWRGCGYQNQSPPSLRRGEDMDRSLMMEETHGMHIKDSTNLSQHTKKKKNSKRFSLETMPQFPPHRHHVPPIKFQTHSPPISPFLPWSIQNKNIPLRPLAKGHTWSLFFFSVGQEEIPHTPEIWSLSRQAAARLVLAPALASTAARGPTHRLRTNGIGYPWLARAKGRQRIALPP